jgi:putative nucleotidyltransferase with HDIG domain
VADPDIFAVLPEIADIEDAGLRDGAVATWTTVWEQSGLGPRLLEVPFSIAAPGEPLVGHIRVVAAAAEALAEVVERRGHPPVDRDLLRTACMLHDVDKPLMVEPLDGGGWRKSAAARRIGHATLGAMLCREHGLPEPVVHLVLTHAVASPLAPEPFEGVLLHYADFFAADTAFFDAGHPRLMDR